jgi:hemoglobin-like flavoprotein
MKSNTLIFQSNPEVDAIFDNYSALVMKQMKYLRQRVLDAADEIEDPQNIEETLKWGEPSYLTKHGSTVRMDWKAKAPDQYAIYFKCTSKLVPTFREIYPTEFTYEGNRALVFSLEEELPAEALKHCIKVALTYHKVKHLPLLGM